LILHFVLLDTTFCSSVRNKTRLALETHSSKWCNSWRE